MAPQRHEQHLPSPPVSFASRKLKILSQLSVPEAEYTDASPKGSVDVGIRELIDELNAVEGYVTTSSCAGRVSVFLEGRKASPSSSAPTGDEQDATGGAAALATIAGPGGKGGGGTWLYVSHDPVPESHDDEEVLRQLGLAGDDDAQEKSAGESGRVQPGRRRRLIHFKFEPMILHVLTASLPHAQLLLKCALAAGFRESGALNLLPASSEDPSVTPVVGVRTMGLGLESLVGYVLDEDNSQHVTVSAAYLRDLVRIANERFGENAARIARFRSALRDAVAGPPARVGDAGGEWEDAAARRERKRAEGLRRREEVAAARQRSQVAEGEAEIDDEYKLEL
ncbi:tRNA wybutosine-synthesizing protein [Colletotrichum plurivorum]|uniref:tRNA(Phe) 7-[(3-amino-3-carboxypropyl)-4-demethylwyosine(37)-N(4)]-methyltransferase n=1 Tax=Colletotrichum plurivorum TaxID=2175906 RepID=A0A8H6JKH4_9PEZI|nr:tRNA wybutosine-synthesizing protein [Colletotrichum plurivorum]